MAAKIVDHLLAHRRFHLFWLAAVTVFFVVAVTGISIGERVLLPGLRVDNSMEVWFRADDPNWVTYKRFQEQFERDEIIFLAFRTEDVFQARHLERIRDLTEKLRDLPHVASVQSLTHVEYFHGEDGVLTVSDLVEEVPQGAEELQQLRRRVLDNPLYAGNLVSDDGRTVAIMIRLEEPEPGENVQRKLTDLLYAFCEGEQEQGGPPLHLAGVPILLGLEDRASTDDATLEYSLSLVLVILVLYALHRRWAYVLISLSVVVVANIWIHGLMALCGSTYNMITTILATLVMVIGIADSIHFLSEYEAETRRGEGSPGAVRGAFRKIWTPCLFTSLTTAAGFSSMAISSLQAVKEFGVYSGVAMLMTFVVNMVLVSVWLSFLRVAPARQRRAGGARWVDRALDKVALMSRKGGRTSAAMVLLVILVSLTGIFRIEINTHEIQYFRKDHPIRVATEFLEEHLTGTIPLEIMLTGPADAFKQPDILRRVEALEQYMAGLPFLRKTFSPVHFLKEINRVVHDGDPAFYRIPESSNLTAQLLLLAEGSGSEEIENYLDLSDLSRARVQGRLNYVGTTEMQELNEKVMQKTADLFEPVGVRAELTGGIPLYLNMVDYLLDSQIRGFSLALFTIFVMLALLVRSLKLALLAMVPNCIPILLTFGIMGWTGIYLDLGTVLIASIAIGLAVDDTIHFIARFRLLFREHGRYAPALEETLRTIGAPITMTSVVLFFGFGIMMVSTFKPIVYFGLLAAITMLSALVADLFVLPAMIRRFKPFGPESRGSDDGTAPGSSPPVSALHPGTS